MTNESFYNGHDYKLVRTKLNLTQSEVADAIGISRHSLSNYEYGKSEMPITVSIRLREFYNVKVSEELLRRRKVKTPLES